MRAETADGPDGMWRLPLLRSDAVPDAFAHAFSTRGGGVSAHPFDTLNLGGKWGDAPAAVTENRRRFQRAAGVTAPVFVARQVHGDAVARVRAGDSPEALAGTAADALITADHGVTLGVFVADCVPVIVVDGRTGACAVVHAGWRGTAAGVLPAAVRALAGAYGARPGDLRVALGPAIGPCCFEVGPEVVAAVTAVLPGARADELDAIIRPSPRGASGKAHVDLKAANRLLLARAGVPPSAIDAGPECTSCDRARFFSYRRDGGVTGQMMAIVGR